MSERLILCYGSILDVSVPAIWLVASLLLIHAIEVLRRRSDRRIRARSDDWLRIDLRASALLSREPDDGEPIEEPSSYPALWERYR